MSVVRTHQVELPVGQLTYSSYGTSGGQVVAAGTETECEFDAFEGNDTNMITKNSNGRIQVNKAGWYWCNLNLNKIDGTDTTCLGMIEYSTDSGANFFDITHWTPTQTINSARSLNTTGVKYLSAGALIRGKCFNYTHNVRYAATSSSNKTQCSLTVMRVG